MVSSKGKEKAGSGDKGAAGKRKIDLGGGKDDDKTGKRNKAVLQFFEDSAFEVGDDDEFSDDSDFFDDDFIEDEVVTDAGVQNERAKAPVFPLVPKEEEMDEEELERMLRERYKPGSSFVTYAEDGYERKGPIEVDISVPSTKDPTIWKVKCMVGRERHSAFCLMQKYADLRTLGMKLQIISAFALDHVKGFIYIEADKQFDVQDACKGLCSIYSSRMAPVPRNEISQLISVRSKCSGISVGMWARVKIGKYKGDLAQVVAVNDEQKKVTVMLVPRIDLQALADKFGGGVVTKKASIPAPKLIRSTELEDFRPLITFRKDRETNQMVEVLDGNMLKDGYLYKKVPIDSLCFWGVMPTETELLKFEPQKNDEPQDTEWLSQLYGERKRKRTVKHDKGNVKGGEKGEGSSSSTSGNSFDVDDLVFFGRKDFGIIIGTEKENVYRIMKEGSEGPVAVTVQLRELRAACFDKKLFTVKDQHKKTISINDIVRVVDGPSKDRQGIVKQIYKGVVFLYDESGEEDNHYVCAKAQMCEKISRSHDLLPRKESEAGPSSGFAEMPSSPNTPLSPKKHHRERDGNSNFSRDDKNGLFSIGQSVRIRVGPLKGYICRVLAVRESDVTVKLDSRQKILTVKSEHLSEVQGKSSTISSCNADSETAKPFDLLGAQDGSADWTAGGVTAAQNDSWNAGFSSSERSSWPSFPASSLPTQLDPNSTSSLDASKDAGSSAWDSGPTQIKSASWGASASGVQEKNVADDGQDGGWGGSDSWKKGTSTAAVGSSSGSDSWGKKESTKNDVSNWGASETTLGKLPESSAWNKAATVRNEGQNEGWGNKVKSGEEDSSVVGRNEWGKSVVSQGEGTSVGNSDAWGGKVVASSSSLSGPVAESGGWGNAAASKQDGGSSWNKQDAGGSSWNKKEDKSSLENQGGQSSWGQRDSKTPAVSSGGGEYGGSSWGKQVGGSWNKQSGVSSFGQQADKDGGSWNKQEGGSSWSKQDGGSGSWNKKEDKSSWNKPGGESSWGQQAEKDSGSQPWNKQDGGSSWGSTQAGGGEFGNKDGSDQQGSWGGGRSFDGGRGSGGRRGGRGGGRGRDNFGRGRGRSFDRGEDNYGSGSASGGESSWKSSQESSWGKTTSSDGGKKNDWGCQNQESSWGNKTTTSDGGKKNDWGSQNQESSWGNKTTSSDGGNKNDWGNQNASGWKNDQSEKPEGDKDTSGGSWNAAKPSGESKSTTWGAKPSANEEKNTSGGGDGWSTGKGSGSETNLSSGGWGSGENSWKTNNKSSASGWKSESTQDPNAWSSKSNWNSGGDDSSNDRGSGGGWRGGRGGSDRGGFGGRGGGSDRGGFGGRGGLDRGGFQGRGDRGGFRGRGDRGGFGGRGRGRRDDSGGDWNNRNDSGDGQPSSWKNGSSGDGGSWKASDNKGSWNNGGDANPSSWNNGASSDGGSWKASVSGNASSSWNSNKPADSGFEKSKETSGVTESGGTADAWGKASNVSGNASSSWGNSNKPADSGFEKPKEASESGGPADAWGKASSSSWGKGSDGAGKGGGW